MDSIEITLKCRRYQQPEIVQIINVFIDEWNTKQSIPMNIVEKIGLVYCELVTA